MYIYCVLLNIYSVLKYFAYLSLIFMITLQGRYSVLFCLFAYFLRGGGLFFETGSHYVA
jgi:hypothetical protein